MMRHRTIVAILALLLGGSSSASGLILTGGPVYSLPGGGSCTISGVASQSGGATITCSSVNLAPHTHVYFGIRNDLNVNGNTMTGVNPAPASTAVFRYLSNTATSITYTSTTTMTSSVPAFGTDTVTNQLVLSRVAGSVSTLPVGGNPTDNNNGDIQYLFEVTSGSSFTLRADVQASDIHFPLSQACPGVYDPSHCTVGAGGDRSKVDVAFYFSDCGDSVVDSPEQCDIGAGNGDPDTCCDANCNFRSSSEVCRPGPGAPCDSSETCSGVSTVCPPDDAPLNEDTVCRAGGGDICDENEACTGTPGQGCPPDDAPGKNGTICRVASVGDFCDMDETCTGAPLAPCPPDDAPGKINQVCRPGSMDMCDPAEQCTGISGQGCPADIVANPSTVCRAGSGDGCDPNENCTAIPGQPCPANVVTPSGTQCRAAAGQCDVAEQCTGTAGQLCPGNGFAAPQTDCDADSDVCTVDECDGSGACVFESNVECEDGNVCTQDSCDPDEGCIAAGTPSTECVEGVKAVLKIRDLDDDTKDSIKFNWKGGPALVSEMGDPTVDTRYELCIYDNRPNVRMAMGVEPGSGWDLIGSPSAPKGYKFKDLTAFNQGIKLIKTKGSSLAKGKAKVIGKGGNLPDDPDVLPLSYPVTAQLYAGDGMCWQAEFVQGETTKNSETGFSAKSQ